MDVSIEISLYPLRDQYLEPIEDFIAALNANPQLKVVTNTMSTQVYGGYGVTMAAVAGAMQNLHRTVPQAAFVMKVLNGNLAPKDLTPA